MEALVCSRHSCGFILLVVSFIYFISASFKGVHARFHFHKNSSKNGDEGNAFAPQGSQIIHQTIVILHLTCNRMVPEDMECQMILRYKELLLFYLNS